MTEDLKKFLLCWPDGYSQIHESCVSGPALEAATKLVAEKVLQLIDGNYSMTGMGRTLYHTYKYD